MRRTRVWTACRRFAVVAIVVTFCLPAVAAPPHLEFLEGLRNARYEDMALYYLDTLESDPQTPPEVKEVLDYERAVTLIRMSRQGSDPGTQARRLDEATAALEKFIAEHPDHALVARAQTERGGILLNKARVSVMEADAPGNEGKAETYRAEARQWLEQAREIFEAARQKYEEQWKSFGPFVDGDDDQSRAARNAALNALIQSRLNLAECTYREARSYAIGQPKRNELFNTAAGQYEAIHADYRSQIGGLFARLWMAKCHEEQAPRPQDGEPLDEKARQDARQRLNIAEAIYTELLEHDTRGARSAAQMQDYAFWFKLIVRNHPALADYQLVIDQANEWLKTRTGASAQTVPALGVRWERAQAYESLANRRDTSPTDQTRFQRAALGDAEFVNAYPGEYRDVSRAMIQRMKVQLGQGTGDPQDFDAAYGLAQTLHNQISERQNAVKEATDQDGKTAAEQDLASHLDETSRILHLALELAGPGTERSSLNTARYLLAHVEYVRNRPYDAAVLGEFVARKFTEESPQLSLDASYLALAAYYRLYAQVPAGEPKDFELHKVRETADFIATRFPDSEQANEARMMLGRLYLQQPDFPAAAEWFAKVPASSPQAMDSRLLAGRAFWDAYAQAAARPEEQRPDQAELDEMKSRAETFLREGLTMADRQIPQDAVPPEDVTAARVSLSQIVNLGGNHQEAVDLLTGGQQPVTKLVAVAEGESRPARGVQSTAFASLAHQQLLRAYIGLQQIDPAIAEMRQLEQIGGEGNTAVFVQLGRQIKNELENQPAGPQRDAVMAAFDQFLGKLSTMSQGQTFGSLLWIGETYYGLAEAAVDPKRSNYFDRAAESYATILSRTNEPGFLPSSDAGIGVKLRLASVEKSRGDFEKSYQLAKEVLQTAPSALNAQVEAATILRDWGMSGRPEAPEKLLLAIQGDNSEAGVPVWGWGQIAQRLQRTLWGGSTNEEFQELYQQARYEIPAARHAYAHTLSDRAAFDQEIGKAEKELTTYVATTPKDEIGDDWFEKLNSLYADIQRDQGAVVIKPLEPATEYTTPPEPSLGASIETAANSAPTPSPASNEQASAATEESSGILPILIGVLLAGAVTAGVVVLMIRGNKTQRRRLSYGTIGANAGPVSAGEVPSFAGLDAGGTAAPAATARRKAKPVAKPAAAKPTAAKPATMKPTSVKPAAAKPATAKTSSEKGSAEGAETERPAAKPKVRRSSGSQATPAPKETAKPSRPAGGSSRAASSEQPLVAKKVRRTKPAE